MSVDFAIKVAQVGKTVGLKGAVRLYFFAEMYEPFDLVPGLIDAVNNVYKISVLSKKSDFWLVKFENFDSCNDAKKLVNLDLFMMRSALPQLAQDEFYHADLYNLNVLDEQGRELGKIVNVCNFGAGDILEIKLQQSGDTMYHPFTKYFVPAVDVAQRRLIINTKNSQ